MKVKIHRIDKSLPLPEYQTEGAVAFDLYARENVTVEANSMGRIPTNLVIEVPKGFMLYIKDRSSTLKKTGLLCTPGFIDQDYHGPGDEILFQAYNPKNEAVTIEKGDRIAQAAFIPIEIPEWEETDNAPKDHNRGGFGSTG